MGGGHCKSSYPVTKDCSGACYKDGYYKDVLEDVSYLVSASKEDKTYLL